MSTIKSKYKRKGDRENKEFTKLGWVFISLGNSIKVTNLLFSKTSLYNYKNLCRLDCLSIEENHVNSDDLVYDIFRIQSACKSL